MDRSFLINDLRNAVTRLHEALARPAEDDVVKAGCIQYFEFSFELAWKAIKAAAEEQGVLDCVSPKACLKYAFKCGWLADENVWLQMLSARNRMSHTYSVSDALSIYTQLTGFCIALEALLPRLESPDPLG